MPTIPTTRFGEIQIDPQHRLRMPEGLLGFPERREFVLFEHKPRSGFFWLQATDAPDLAFVIVDPFQVRPDYLDGLPPAEKRLFDGVAEGRAQVGALVTIVPDRTPPLTVNLMAPLVIDMQARTARQVVLTQSGYPIRHPIPWEGVSAT